MKAKRNIAASLVNRMKTPWLVVFLYNTAVLVNWVYAYVAQTHPELINNSWSLLFPLISFLYLEFCFIAVVGIYLRLKWGFGLGYVTITCGLFMAAMSYLLVFKIDPSALTYFIWLLVLNFIVIMYMIFYYQHHRMNPDI